MTEKYILRKLRKPCLVVNEVVLAKSDVVHDQQAVDFDPSTRREFDFAICICVLSQAAFQLLRCCL